jgi:hypothetical protein
MPEDQVMAQVKIYGLADNLLPIRGGRLVTGASNEDPRVTKDQA